MINQANRHPGHATRASTRPVETFRPRVPSPYVLRLRFFTIVYHYHPDQTRCPPSLTNHIPKPRIIFIKPQQPDNAHLVDIMSYIELHPPEPLLLRSGPYMNQTRRFNKWFPISLQPKSPLPQNTALQPIHQKTAISVHKARKNRLLAPRSPSSPCNKPLRSPLNPANFSGIICESHQEKSTKNLDSLRNPAQNRQPLPYSFAAPWA